MKICKKITNAIAKVAEWICMLMIALLVVVIVGELINRNIFHSSFRPTIEICGIAFLWMAFIGVIVLYNNDGLMKLDFVSANLKGVPAQIIYFINKASRHACLILIGQHLVRFVDFLELCFSLFIAWVQIRVVLFSRLSICFFYFVVCGAFRNTQDLIIISLICQENSPAL